MQSLQSAIERLASLGEVEGDPHARQVFMDFRDELTQGKIRAAEKINGQWVVNIWVKLGILLGFRLGELSKMGEDASLSFVDKDTFPARRFTVPGPGARGAGRIVGAAGRLRGAHRHLHASYVHQRGRLRG